MGDIDSRDIAYTFINTGAHLDMAAEMARVFINTGAYLEAQKFINKEIESLQAKLTEAEEQLSENFKTLCIHFFHYLKCISSKF